MIMESNTDWLALSLFSIIELLITPEFISATSGQACLFSLQCISNPFIKDFGRKSKTYTVW